MKMTNDPCLRQPIGIAVNFVFNLVLLAPFLSREWSTTPCMYIILLCFLKVQSINFKMSFWCLQIFQKTNEFFSRISALVFRNRSNHKSKGTLYHQLEDSILTLLHYFLKTPKRHLEIRGCSQTTFTRGGGKVVKKNQLFVNFFTVENVNGGG